MKSIRSLIFNSFYIAISFSVLESCSGPAQPGSWKDAEIKSSIQSDFHQRNQDLFKLLKQGDVNGLKNYESGEMVDNPGISRMVERVGNHLKSEDYTLLDEYYVVNKFKGEDTLSSGRKDINKYKLFYNTENQEMYLSFFIPKKGDNKWLITAIWSKYSYGWKLSSLDLGKYTINGKTAPELLEFAKQEYAKHYLVNATNIISLASQCSSPAEIWRYEQDAEIDSLNGKLTAEANEKISFPYTLASIPTQPKIVSIFNQDAGDGAYPAIYYITHLKLSDTAAIKRENESIKKIIGKAIPGIDKDKKLLFYSAFNEMPSSARGVQRFDMVQKIQ